MCVCVGGGQGAIAMVYLLLVQEGEGDITMAWLQKPYTWKSGGRGGGRKT